MSKIESIVQGGERVNPGSSHWHLLRQAAGESEGMCTVPIAPDNLHEQVTGRELGLTGENQRSTQDRPTEIGIWNVILSFKKSFELFLQYLGNKLNVFVRRHDVGSLLITVECSSLQILEGLWEDYNSGHLNEVAQEMLISAEVLEKLGLTEVKMKTFISDEEYEKGKRIFMDNSGESIRSSFRFNFPKTKTQVITSSELL